MTQHEKIAKFQVTYDDVMYRVSYYGTKCTKCTCQEDVTFTERNPIVADITMRNPRSGP